MLVGLQICECIHQIILLIIRFMMRITRRRQQNQEHVLNRLHREYYNLDYNFNRDYRRAREFSPSPCKMCTYCNGRHHSQNDKCYFFCIYCQSIHLKKSMNNIKKFDKNMICPMLQQQILQQQNKKAFNCEKCEGNGTFQKIIQTTFLEPKAAFQKRLAQYQKLKQTGYNQLQPPHREVFRSKLESWQEICETCKGQGKIYKMTYCCQNGCPQCVFTKIKINPQWRQIRLKGKDNDKPFRCIICFQDVSVGEKIFKMNCGHSFHRGCILCWLHLNEGCYKCNQVDPYLERHEFPEEYLDRLQLIKSIIKQKNSHKRLNDIVFDSKRKEIKRKDHLKGRNTIKQSQLPSEDSDQWVTDRSSLQQSFYSLSFVEKSESERQIPEHQNANNDSFIIGQATFQNEQRDLSFHLSGINNRELQQNNHEVLQNIENQNTFSQNLFKQQQVEKKNQQIVQLSSEVEQRQQIE